jgi:hypothetical protein
MISTARRSSDAMPCSVPASSPAEAAFRELEDRELGRALGEGERLALEHCGLRVWHQAPRLAPAVQKSTGCVADGFSQFAENG